MSGAPQFHADSFKFLLKSDERNENTRRVFRTVRKVQFHRNERGKSKKKELN